jgi:hypothetical protein
MQSFVTATRGRDPLAYDAANLSSSPEDSRSHWLSAENEIAIDSPMSVVAQLIGALAGLARRSLLGALTVCAGKLAERSL